MAEENKAVTAVDDELTAFERFVKDFTNGLNGVLYILCKEVETNPAIVTFGMIFEAAQLVRSGVRTAFTHSLLRSFSCCP